MSCINESLLKKVESALSIKLYPGQRNYLLYDDPYWFGGRRSGKTTAFCIKLALSEGPPLDLKCPEKWCDNDFGIGSNRFRYGQWFRGQFLDIWTTLRDAGIKVRDIKRKR